MNEIEQLAIMQALYNVIGGEVKTGDPGNLRGRVNGLYIDLYEQTGATGFEVRLNGTKVGTYGFNKTKAEPAKTVTTIEVVDYAMLRAYEDDNWLDWIGRWTVEHIGELAREYVEQTGEVLPGVDVRVEEIPAKPAGIRPNGTLRVYPDKVAQAMGNQLGETVRGLLESSNN